MGRKSRSHWSVPSTVSHGQCCLRRARRMSPRPSRPPGKRSTPADGRGPRRPGERQRLLRRLGELISERADDLARLQVRENGKVLREVLAQTKGLTDYCNYFAGLAETRRGRPIPSSAPDVFVYTVREPVGGRYRGDPVEQPAGPADVETVPRPGDGQHDGGQPSEVARRRLSVLGDVSRPPDSPRAW